MLWQKRLQLKKVENKVLLIQTADLTVHLTNTGSNFKGFHMWLIEITSSTQMGKKEKAC